MVVPLAGNLNDSSLLNIEAEVLEHCSANSKIRGMILDISAFDSIDLFSARMLVRLAKKLSLMDLQTVVVGIQPDVALTLVEIGLTTVGVETAFSLEHGLQKLEKQNIK